MSDCPMLISNKLHSFRNFMKQKYEKERKRNTIVNTETGSMAYFIKMMDIRHQ